MSVIKKNNATEPEAEDNFRLQYFLSLCLNRKWWFVVSVLLCFALASIYLLCKQPVYTRSSSVQLKTANYNDNSLASELSSVSGMGVFNNNSDVTNEIVYFQSPDLIMEVVKRLGIDVTYLTDGTFHKKTLYGQSLPVTVTFYDLVYSDNASLTVTLNKKGEVKLSDFKRNGKECGDGKTLAATLGSEIKTPLGRLIVARSVNYTQVVDDELSIYVKRSNLMSAVSSNKGKLKVSKNDKDNDIIDLTYSDVSIQRAEDFLNMLIAVYNENWIKDKNQIAVSTSQFIGERLAVIESDLGNVDSDISSYKSANLVPDVAAASQMAMTTANQASVQISDLTNKLYMAQYVRDHIKKAGNTQLLPANSGLNAQAIESQIGEYNTKLLQRNSLVANSSEESPLVIEMDKQLTSMRAALISSLDNEVGTIESQINGLRSVEGVNTSKMASNPTQAKYLLSVERQQKVKESLYLFLLQKREENELSQAFTAYNTRIIMSPTGSMSPSSPNRRRIFLAALLLGLLIPMLIIYVSENMNNCVRGRKDLEGMEMPLVGEIPLYGRKTRYNLFDRIFGKKKKKDVYEIVVKPKSHNIINEAFRIVRTNLEFMTNSAPNRKVFMVTSANPESGKTFISMNLASSFSIKGLRVVTVDLDLRRASLSQFVSSPKVGVSEYLNGKLTNWRDIVVSMPNHEGLDIIPVGVIPPNPAELLFSPLLEKLIAELRENYDIVLLDCPPVELVADTNVIARWADMTIFVVRAGLMLRDMLPNIDEFYTEKKFNNMVMLLNGTEAEHSRYGYGYGYGYGYRYNGYSD